MTPTIERLPIHQLRNNDLVPISAPVRALASSIVGKIGKVRALDSYSTRPEVRADSRKAIAEMMDLLKQLGAEMDRKQ